MKKINITTFSILLRIVRGETNKFSLLPIQFERLSVSSYGSCGVKPIINEIEPYLVKTFSILLRIVRGETKRGRNRNIQLQIFQYPLTDRAG